MTKILLDKEKCIGCGACQSVCHKYFELDEDGKSKLKKEEVKESDINCVRETIKSCPVQCIKIDK